MHCPSCGKERRQNSNYCPYCGVKQKRKGSAFTIIFLSLLLVGTIVGSAIFVTNFYASIDDITEPENTATQSYEPEEDSEAMETSTLVSEKQELEAEQKHELTEIISSAQETVYTIFTQYSQGSGFLYNNNGAVITNAHVVEGETDVYIKTIDGIEYPGSVIGYSNETDVAVVLVPDLVGTEPFALETTDTSMIGEEIIALGSPLGLENTATMGYITGKNRSFIIDPYVYENLYQISAPISPGSSGGPLISKNTEKIVAINSAESIEDASIGFSIPLYTVQPLIESWINQPMSEDDILAQFYDSNYYDDSWGEGYFDGGDYAEDEEYYDYWEYGYEDFWTEFGDALWEYMEEEDSYYDDWYDEEYYESYEEDWYDDGSYDSYEDEYYDEGYTDPSSGDEYYDEGYDNSYEDEYFDEGYYDSFEDENYDPTLDENMHYDEATGEWSYYDEVEDQWYYYDEFEETWYYFDDLDGLWYYYDQITEKYVPY